MENSRDNFRMDNLKTCTILSELNLANDHESWFYGVRDRDERVTSHDQVVSNEVKEKRKLKGNLFEDALGCFMVYKRQNEALIKCEQEGPMSRIFPFEHSIYHPGQRHFLVSTVERFWHWYKKQNNASFYELIPRNRPARLYFDLEFYRETNSDVDEGVLINDFNDGVAEVLMEMFGIGLNPEKEMLVLDASTTTKFSEHIIVHLPDNSLFPSNIAIKSFIQRLEEKMISSKRCLVWNVNATKMVTFFDASVYSTNRNFRLYLSSKLGKNNPLVLSKRCRFYAHRKCPSKQQIFSDSLVVPAEYNGSDNVLHISMDENGEYLNNQNSTSKILAVPVVQAHTSSEYVDYMTGYGATSPFPVLDQHIIAINRRWKDNASIRHWKLSMDKFTRSRRITYYILHCRYCFNIAREHRSNGIFWIVDLDKMHCFQKCFDVDCSGISSNYFPLPNFVCTSIPSAKDLSLGDNEAAIQTSKLEEKDDELPEKILYDLVREAKEMNEVEVQKRMQRFRRRSAAMEMKALRSSGNSFELTDDELLRAFAEVDD